MTTTNFKMWALTILVGLMMGCSKEEDPLPINPPENPGAEDVNFVFHFPVSGDQDDVEAIELEAVISLNDSAGTSVWSNKAILLEISEDGMATAELILKQGSYSLEKLIILDESGSALFATPLKNSVKGQMIDFSLPVFFDLKTGQENRISQPVVKVPVYASPDHYGYENIDFGENRFFTVRMKAEMSVGQFLFDGLQANVHITATSDQGDQHDMVFILEPGMNELELPALYSTFTILWTKWNFSEELVFSRDELVENGTVILHGDQPAKMLKSEESYHEIQGIYVPYSRTEYFYNAEEKLVRKDFYQKKPQSSELILQMITEYAYDAAGKLQKMELKNPDQSYYKEAVYTWEDDMIKSIYATGPEGMNVNFRYDEAAKIFRADYSLTNGHYFSYGYQFENGNKVKEMPYGGSTTNIGSGNFEYDDFINPYYLWGITDEFMRYSSRNNEIRAEYNYSGGFPSFIPENYNYSYDADGYPDQLVRTFITYQTKEFGYREKIQYHYD
jgi:hypothetical protein